MQGVQGCAAHARYDARHILHGSWSQLSWTPHVEQVKGYSESVFLPLDTDSFKAPLSGLSVSPALSETGATAADILCHLDSATPQTQLVSYGTGHFWCVWTQDPIVDDSVEATVLPSEM
ncbi:hypothetical protein BASA83_012877 [Batrachochytrium salamandrivorans]|nr:hypothetical protein BASA83_012877 [Batrachochytrium salamandrivorans]